MRRFSKRKGLQTLSEINVTPMLDLCFVLLVIFMITTPLLENNADLALPTGAGSDHPVDPEKVRTVAVDRNESLQLDGAPVTLAQLRTRLETLHDQQGNDLAVVIRAHKQLTVQDLMGVWDAVHAAHIVKVGIITEAPGTPP